MMIRVEQRLTVAEFLAAMDREHGGLRAFREYVRRHPKDRPAALDLEEYEHYMGHPELAASTMERAVSLIPVAEEALALFTARRLSLLEALAEAAYPSVRELARNLKRDVHNVSADLRLFRELGLVAFERGPRNRRAPRLVGDSVRVEFGRPPKDRESLVARERRILRMDAFAPLR